MMLQMINDVINNDTDYDTDYDYDNYLCKSEEDIK